MFCPNCGNKCVSGAVYCAECGRKLPNLEKKYGQKTEKTQIVRSSHSNGDNRSVELTESEMQQIYDLMKPRKKNILSFQQEVKRRNPEKYAEIQNRRRMEAISRIRCPKCGSTTFMKEDSMLYRYRRRSSNTTNSQMIAVLVFALFEAGVIVFFGREYRCLRCGRRWRTKE